MHGTSLNSYMINSTKITVIRIQIVKSISLINCFYQSMHAKGMPFDFVLIAGLPFLNIMHLSITLSWPKNVLLWYLSMQVPPAKAPLSIILRGLLHFWHLQRVG